MFCHCLCNKQFLHNKTKLLTHLYTTIIVCSKQKNNFQHTFVQKTLQINYSWILMIMQIKLVSYLHIIQKANVEAYLWYQYQVSSSTNDREIIRWIWVLTFSNSKWLPWKPLKNNTPIELIIGNIFEIETPDPNL